MGVNFVRAEYLGLEKGISFCSDTVTADDCFDSTSISCQPQPVQKKTRNSYQNSYGTFFLVLLFVSRNDVFSVKSKLLAGKGSRLVLGPRLIPLLPRASVEKQNFFFRSSRVYY